jgi:hypothetical protein
MLVVYMHVVFLLGFVTQVPIILDSLSIFYMYGHSSYLVACTPRKELLIYQLHCEKLLLAGLLSPEVFQVQRKALDLRCIDVTFGLPLPVVPPAV